MQPITLTLVFTSLSELALAASRLASIATVIAPDDRPDAGDDLQKSLAFPHWGVAPSTDPVAVFGRTPAATNAPAAAPQHATAFAAPGVTLPAGVVPPAVIDPAALAAGTGAVVPQVPTIPAAGPVASVPAAPTVPAPPLAAPPAPIAPTATAAQPPAAAPAPNVELDRNGLPWDRRIHSETRAKIADGSWRKKRGTADTYVVQIEAELRQAMAAGPVAAAAAPQAPATTGGAYAPKDFGDLMAKLEPHISGGALTNLAIATALGRFQLANWFQLANRPDLVASVAATPEILPFLPQ